MLSLDRFTVKVQWKNPKITRKGQIWTGITGASNVTIAVNFTELALILLQHSNWVMA